MVRAREEGLYAAHDLVTLLVDVNPVAFLGSLGAGPNGTLCFARAGGLVKSRSANFKHALGRVEE